MSAVHNPEPILIKKYANRRLYNTQTSCYVTLEDLRELIKNNEDFVVRDAKTEEDLTNIILAQIILDQEGKGTNLLPLSFMRDIIRAYDNSLQQMLPTYLESSMAQFKEHQESWQKKWQEMTSQFTEFTPLKFWEELARQQTQWWKDGVPSFFNPFMPNGDTKEKK